MAARFSPCGTMFATGGYDQKVGFNFFFILISCLAQLSEEFQVFLWNVYGECENFSMLGGHTGTVMDLHFNTDARFVLRVHSLILYYTGKAAPQFFQNFREKCLHPF